MTILTEIESTINSRPLTFVSSEELEEPLTPSHLICRKRLCSLLDVNNKLDLNEGYVEEVTTGTPTKRMKYVMYLKFTSRSLDGRKDKEANRINGQAGERSSC